MKTAHFLQKDSIATQLTKFVFAWYCIVASLITISQVVVEYGYTKSQIIEELAANKKIFEPVLSVALWNLDQQQLQSSIDGMMAIPIIRGVRVMHNESQIKAVGQVVDDNNIRQTYDQFGDPTDLTPATNGELISYSFDVFYTYRNKGRKVGKVIVYSDSTAIFKRVEVGIILIIINSVIKTFALWLLFYFITRQILLKPLNQLIETIKETDLETASTLKVDLHSNRKNELTLIEDAFSQMLGKLTQSRNQIINFNTTLEAKVKQRTTDLEAAKEQAELANNAKTVFMSRINHEIRTPLNAILGYSEILNYKLAGNDYPLEQNSVNHIVEAANHLLVFFEDIMDILVTDTKKVNIPLENCDTASIIDSSVILVRDQAKLHNITIDNQTTKVYALTNPERLKQIIVNLLCNAIKYNKHNGHICITSTVTENATVQIKIKDTGVGIAQNELSKIFEPLSRLQYAEQQAIKGFGIGLSIAKNLVERMNGSISVASEPEQGSEFTVTIPSEIR
jgi:signal transduction histidine kinase